MATVRRAGRWLARIGLAALVVTTVRDHAAGDLARLPGSWSAQWLAVLPLRDAGGGGEPGSDGSPLHARLTRGLSAYLADAARGRVTVVPDDGPMRKEFSLQGEISKPEDRPRGEGPYLLVLRLFREEDPRRLVGQWAGVADTIRDLSGNIRRDPRVDPNGLTGELCKRAVATMVGGSWRQMEAFDKFLRSTRSNGLEAKLLPATGGGYRLEATADAPGTAFVVETRAGVPRALLKSEGNRVTELPAGKRVVLPASKSFAPQQKTDGHREVIVLVRRRAEPVVRAAEPAEESPPNVRVIEDAREAPADAGVDRLLQLAATDPPGTWRSRRIPLTLVSSPLDLYRNARTDPSKLLLEMGPKKSTVKVGEQLDFTIKVGSNGFLVVVEQGPSGNVRLMHPLSRKIEDAQVKAASPSGAKLTLPADATKAFAPDRPGAERLRAFLFSSREAAAGLLELFPERLVLTPAPMVLDARLQDEKMNPIVSEVTFEVIT